MFRPYQSQAIAAAVAAHAAGENPVESLPTGGGKSLVAAGIAAELSAVGTERIIVTVPSRELAEQNEGALKKLLPEGDIGVVCAALGRRELDRRIIVGTPQSLAGNIKFDPTCVLVDECHQMPLHRGSWFAKLFDSLPRGRETPRIGLSATTFRTADGAIYGGPKSWFSCQPFEISVQELVDLGFLAPVRYVAPGTLMTTRGVAKSAGDFNQTQLANANLDQVPEQVEIILDKLADRRKAMIFAVNVKHATTFVEELHRRGERAALIVGDMDPEVRKQGVAEFKAGTRRIAVTVSAGLTGFDVPDIDLIASCRPTMSPIIHVQSIGRGTRPAEGKVECVALDFAGNVKTFGPVHRPHFDKSGQPRGGVAPWRPCRACGTFNHFEEAACTHCGTTLTVRHAMTARELEFGSINFHRESMAINDLIANRGFDTTRMAVESIAVHAYRSKRDPNSVTCMVSFGLGGDAIVRSWFKRFKGKHWKEFWRMLLGDAPPPTSLPEAVGRKGELVRPSAIHIQRDGDFWRIEGVTYDDEEDEPAGAAERMPAGMYASETARQPALVS